VELDQQLEGETDGPLKLAHVVGEVAVVDTGHRTVGGAGVGDQLVGVWMVRVVIGLAGRGAGWEGVGRGANLNGRRRGQVGVNEVGQTASPRAEPRDAGLAGLDFNTNDYAFFAQDEWKVSPRLSLALGVRYEYERLPDPKLANSLLPQTSKLNSYAGDISGHGSSGDRNRWSH